MTITRRQETAAVKKALKAAGYTDVQVTHGRGTAWGWLSVRVERQGEILSDWQAQHDAVRMIAEKSSGRDTEHQRSQITVVLDRREG